MNAPSATTKTKARRAVTAFFGIVVLAVACASFRYDIDRETLFVDEAAFLSQSYFWDLAISGRWDDPFWLEYAAYDLPPLPKYLIGASLQLHGLRAPARAWALAWYRDTSKKGFVSPLKLQAARQPTIYLGAIGCLAIFAIGTFAQDRRVGLLAASLLMVNPLYRLHARRAMADVPAEALVLITLAMAIGLWKRCVNGRVWPVWLVLGPIAVGVSGGLAVLAKLNGGLALMTVGAWALLAVLVARRSGEEVQGRAAGWRFAGMTAFAGVIALITFIALNPFITARPDGLGTVPLMAPVPPNQTILQRLTKVIEHRVEVSRHGQTQFPHDALRTIPEKAAALAIQGFGRFGPFGPGHADSRRRFDAKQDWGAAIWLPCVSIGLLWAILHGARQSKRSEAPTSWALVTYFLVAVATVGLFLPLAWDRYFLPIQASAALLVSGAAVAGFDAIRSRVART